jgi:hypothetical protein
MSYRRSYRSNRRPEPRTLTVKYAAPCACCGARIEVGETATYYPPGAYGENAKGVIVHVAYSWDEGQRVSLECFNNQRKAMEQRAVNDHAGDGLDERWEDAGRDVCGL